MKLTKFGIVMAVVAIGLCADVLAAEAREYPQIAFVGPGAGKHPIDRSQLIILVVEGPILSYEKNLIPASGEVDYVNHLLKDKGVAYIGVYTRKGVKYGDVLRAIDVLRQSNAKNIGVSMVELPDGREP